MKMKFKNLIAVVCSCALLLQTIPLTALADTSVKDKSLSDQVIQKEANEQEAAEPEIIGEDISKREPSVKHFRRSDGSYTAAIYNEPVHYEENGKLVDIDNTLVSEKTADGSEYLANKSNALKVKLPKQSDKKTPIEVNHNGYTLSWTMDMQDSAPAQVELPKAKSEKIKDLDSQIAKAKTKNEQTKLKNQKFTDLSGQKSSITYRSLKKNVDVKYDIQSSKLKESIVLDSLPEQTSFTYNIKCGNMTAELQEDSSVYFYSNENKEPEFIIEAPYMFDDKQELSQNIVVKLISTKTGYAYTIVPDATWLASADRVFPITIDPSIITSVDRDQLETAHIQEQHPTTVSGQAHLLYAGSVIYNGIPYKNWTYVRLPMPSQITPSQRIIDAKLYMNYYPEWNLHTRPTKINLHNVLSPWSEDSVTWNNQPSSDLNTVIDYAIADQNKQEQWDSFDITSLAQGWINSTIPNNGVLLKEAFINSSITDRVCYFSEDLWDGYMHLRPSADIEYRDTIGLEDYWTAHTQDLGRSGTGYVKDFNAALTWVHNDVSFDAGVNSINLSHVYNSNSRAYSPTSNANNPGTYAGFMGKGWNLNIVQRLYPNQDSGTSGNYPFVYIDGDGTEHYIMADGNIDEDGLGLEYSFLNGDIHSEYYQLKAKDGSMLRFDIWGNLRKMVDTNGNTTLISYAPLNSPTGIGHNYPTVVSTAAGSVYLGYDDYGAYKRLRTITDTAGRVTTYDYEGDLLRKIYYPDGKVTEFVYYNNILHQVIHPDGSKIWYGHNAFGGISSIFEVGTNGETGNGYSSISLSYLQTVYTSNKQKDGVYPTETYQFSTFGNTTCVYDQDGNAATQSFGNTPGFNNNKPLTSAQTPKTVENKFLNPVFAENLSNWIVMSGSVSVTSEQKYCGAKSVQITNADSSGYACIAQTGISLAEGTTYTVSGYFKTSNVVSSGYGAALEVRTNGGVGFYSDWLTGSTDSSINDGWQRLSCTFTLPVGDSVNRITAGVYNGTGTVYVTGLQLEKGNVPNQLDLFRDSGFERTDGTVGQVHTGSYSKKLTGNYGDANSSYSLGVSGNGGDIYTFGGWAKADSVPDGKFSISAAVIYTDGSVRWTDCNFNRNVDQWQYMSAVLDTKDPNSPGKAYQDIHLYVYYSNNINTAYFDDIFVYRDTAQSYTYDSKGNLVSSTDAAKQQSEFQYDSSSNLKSLISPDGKDYKYFYDVQKNLTKAQSAEGLSYDIVNDQYGNPVSTAVSGKKIVTTIEDQKIYNLRNLNSGLYLEVENSKSGFGTKMVQNTYNGQTSQRFKAYVKENGDYMLEALGTPSYVLNGGPYTTTPGGQVSIWGDATGTSDQINERWKFVYDNQKSAFKVKLASCNYNMVLDAKTNLDPYSPVVLWHDSETAPQLYWVLEEVTAQQQAESRSAVSALKTGKVYEIKNYYNGYYMETVNSDGNIGTEFIQNPYSGKANQRFRAVQKENGDYMLQVMNTPSYVLNGGGYTTTPGTHVNVWDDVSATSYKVNQRWKFVYDASKNAFKIKLASCNYGMVLDGRDTLSPGGEVILYNDVEAPQLYWVIEEVRDEAQTISTSASYDSTGGYIKDMTDAAGNTTQYVNNPSTGLLTDVTNAKGTATAYTYNTNDTLKTVSSGGALVEYDYNTDNSLKTITHNGFNYGFTYDAFGNSKTVSVGGATLITNNYASGNGNLTSSVYGNGASVSYGYDRYDRVTSRQWNGRNASTIKYDAGGNVYESYDGLTGITSTFQYDLIGRILGVSSSNGLRQWLTYDSKNRTDSVYTRISGVSHSKLTFVYGQTNQQQNASQLYGIKLNDEQRLWYDYDKLGRLNARYLLPNKAYQTAYTYKNNANGTTTSQLAGIKNGGNAEITYTYDALGNIETIREDGVLKATYQYDALNQLIREDNAYTGKSVTYAYDAGGNLTVKNEYAYTTGTLGAVTRTVPYGYTDANWKDKLTSYDGQALTYDAIGNPLQYRDGMSMTWQNGRQLATLNKAGLAASYQYNDSGIRTQKTVNGAVTDYYLSGSNILAEVTGGVQTDYYYDENGNVFGFKKNGADYYYIRNGQNDIIGILDSSGNQVVSYVYDTWGKLVSISGSLASTIGAANPFRYRGYHYDNETGFYYLNSRYYDPGVGRFINADGTVDTNTGLLSHNMFAYCNNNPVSMILRSTQNKHINRKPLVNIT